MEVYRGLFFCANCGRVASERPRLLLTPCPGFALPSGQHCIVALRAGRRPWGVARWPSERSLAMSAWIECSKAAQ